MQNNNENYPQPDWDVVEYKGFWLRFIAHIIDMFIAGIVFGLVIIVFFGADQLLQMNQASSPMSDMIIRILSALFIILFWKYKSATPGKMIINAKIVDASTGGKLSYKQCIIRYIGFSLIVLAPSLLIMLWLYKYQALFGGANPFAPYALWIYISQIFFLGGIWIGFDGRKQGWHDKLANTVVIDSDYMPLDYADEADS